jgi:hypothetical protein
LRNTSFRTEYVSNGLISRIIYTFNCLFFNALTKAQGFTTNL